MRCSLVCMLLLAACYRDHGGRTSPPPPDSGAVGGSIGRDYRDAINDPLGFLPVDSEVVLGVDGDQLRNSELWKQLEPSLLAKVGAQLSMLRALCKLDPIKAIHSVSFGVKGVGNDNPDAVVVVHGLGRDTMMACLAQGARAAVTTGSPDKFSIDHGVVSIPATADQPNNIIFQWVDRTTVVFVIGLTANKPLLASVIASGSPLRASPAFTAMFSLVDTSGALWLLVSGNSKVFDQAAALGMKPKAVFGSVSLVDGLLINMRIRLASAPEASQLVALAQGQLGAMKSWFDRLEVTADAVDVVIAVAMSTQQVQSLISMFGSYLGSP